MKAKRGMLALLEERTVSYGANYKQTPRTDWLVGYVTKISRDGVAKEVSVFGRALVVDLKHSYNKYKLLGLTGDVDVSAVEPIISDRQSLDADKYNPWSSAQEVIDFLRKYKK